MALSPLRETGAGEFAVIRAASSSGQRGTSNMCPFERESQAFTVSNFWFPKKTEGVASDFRSPWSEPFSKNIQV